MSNKIPNITVGGGILTTSAAAFNSTLPVVMATKREYKTLPRSFQEVRKSSERKKESYSQASSNPKNDEKANKSRHQGSATNIDGEHSAMYNLNMGLSNFISGGMHFLGQLGRRKNSATSGTSSPPPRSASALDQLSSSSESNCMSNSTSEAFQSAFSSIANANNKDANSINEMESFEMRQLTHQSQLPHAEGGDWEEGCSGRYIEDQVGRGHDFAPLGTFNPTWCDLCRELVWGLYDTGATRCIRCHLTCHVKCQYKIRLNCVASDADLVQHDVGDDGSQSDSSTLSSSSSTSSADEIDHDESTLFNISTLKEEYHSCVDVSSRDIIAPPDEFSDKENDEDDEDDYNRTLKDVSLLEDFTLDDDTPTTLPKDPFPTLSAAQPSVPDTEVFNDPSINTSQTGFPICIATLNSVLADDEQLEKALAEYNNNTPDGQKTIVIPSEDDNQIKPKHSIESIDPDIASSQEPPSTDSFAINRPFPYKRECRGHIRVVMNLRRPINVHPGTRPPSTYTIPPKRDISGTLTLTQENADRKEVLTSFYLPVDTVKALHVTTLTSVHDVIRTLLGKFRVVDNPHKFALYEKVSTLRGIMSRRQSRKNSFTSQGSRGEGTRSSQRRASRTTLVRHNLRKMSNEERPLVLALARCLKEKDDLSSENEENIDKSRGYFVLQENDPGEMIYWESFSTPELKNFLRILDREEAWYKKRIHEKYEFVLLTMQKLMEEKRPQGLSLDDLDNPSSQSEC